MQYALLIYGNDSAAENAPPAERETIMKEFGAFTSSIQKSGWYRGGEAFQPTRAATTVRAKDGHVITVDGAFEDTKEQLGGFFLIDASNLDEAMAIAARVPSVHARGSVEIRPVQRVSRRDEREPSSDVQPLELSPWFEAPAEALCDAWLTSYGPNGFRPPARLAKSWRSNQVATTCAW